MSTTNLISGAQNTTAKRREEQARLEAKAKELPTIGAMWDQVVRRPDSPKRKEIHERSSHT